MLKTITIDELKPGMMITQVVEQNGPVKIRKVGLVRSGDMITGLAEMGVARVEIDPEQSVELEPEEAPTSMTQKLLQGEYDHASQVDKSLSDQFNRSLFLPSVSELPSMWQIYAKQAGLALSVVFIGMCIGFAVSLLPKWFQDEPAIALEQPTGLSEPAPSAAETNTQPPEAIQQELADENSLVVDSQSNSETSIANNQGQSVEPATVSENAVLDVSTADDTEDGELLTQSADDSSLEGVSPELLQRFNQALEQLENQPESNQRETTVSVVDDIPRVDQLPARLLTRLPAMTFSAHMYASNRDSRWVRVNGQQLYEGEWIEDGLQIINIEPQRVVLSFRGELFAMAALTDW